jgi:hypothetical protein
MTTSLSIYGTPTFAVPYRLRISTSLFQPLNPEQECVHSSQYGSSRRHGNWLECEYIEHSQYLFLNRKRQL